MNKGIAVATLQKLGDDNPSIKKFTDKIIAELNAPKSVTELEAVKVLFRSGSTGELLTNSLILAVKQENIKVVLTKPTPVIVPVVEDVQEKEIVEEKEMVMEKVKPLYGLGNPLKINNID